RDGDRDLHGDPEPGGIPARGLAAFANLLAQRTHVLEGGGGNHDIIRHARGHADLRGGGDLDRERRSVDENLAKGPRVFLHALPRASLADLEAAAEYTVGRARHRGTR